MLKKLEKRSGQIRILMLLWLQLKKIKRNEGVSTKGL